MKSADIKVGEEYAVGPAWKAKPYRGKRGLRRAKVEETRVESRPRYGYGGATTKSGVKVWYTDGTHAVIPSREVHQVWAEYEAEEKERAEVRAKNEADEHTKYSAAVKRIESVLPDDMLFGDVPQKFRGLKSWQIEPLADLLEKVYENGALAEAPWKR